MNNFIQKDNENKIWFYCDVIPIITFAINPNETTIGISFLF